MKLRAVVVALRGIFGYPLEERMAYPMPPAITYPYYAVDPPKAIKVRFREGRNAREVMDFNLHLSPDDVWSAHIASREFEELQTWISRFRSCTPSPRGNTLFRWSSTRMCSTSQRIGASITCITTGSCIRSPSPEIESSGSTSNERSF